MPPQELGQNLFEQTYNVSFEFTIKTPTTVPSEQDPSGIQFHLSYKKKLLGPEQPGIKVFPTKATARIEQDGRVLRTVELLAASDDRFYRPGMSADPSATRYTIYFSVEVIARAGNTTVARSTFVLPPHPVSIHRVSGMFGFSYSSMKWREIPRGGFEEPFGPEQNHHIRFVNWLGGAAECWGDSMVFYRSEQPGLETKMDFGAGEFRLPISATIPPGQCGFPKYHLSPGRRGAFLIAYFKQNQAVAHYVIPLVGRHHEPSTTEPNLLLERADTSSFYASAQNPCIGMPVSLPLRAPPLRMRVRNRSSNPVTFCVGPPTSVYEAHGGLINEFHGRVELSGSGVSEQALNPYTLEPGAASELTITPLREGKTLVLVFDPQLHIYMAIPIQVSG